MRRWRNSALVVAAVAGALAATAPAGAQMLSPGYQFLKAIKDLDSDKLVELMDKNSSTIVNSQELGSGDSALHILVSKKTSGALTWMKYLIQQGANVNITNKEGMTPLVLACQTGWLEGAQVLIDYHAKVDIPNSTGETPLIAAVHRRDVPLMRILLKGGADPDRADSAGRTAREYAQQGGASLVAEIEKNEKPKAQREGAKTYGPSF